MGRRPKTERVPRTRANSTWTEASFWGFIRGLMREGFKKWPPKYKAKQLAKRPYRGTNKRQRFEYQCAACTGWFTDKETQVDHIVPCGTLKSWDDLSGFAERMFVETDGLQVLCKNCHENKPR
jgi:5-methylcytosine-specific restriction endonuclease McrA